MLVKKQVLEDWREPHPQTDPEDRRQLEASTFLETDLAWRYL